MTLTEQKTEYEEIKDLLKTALSNSLSAGSLVGYTTNGTKIVYEGATKTAQLLCEYNQKIAHIEHQIASLNFIGVSV